MAETRRRTLAQVRVEARIHKSKVDATSDDDVRGYLAEDGLGTDHPLGRFSRIVKVDKLRKRTGLSQDAFAKATQVPAGTVRDWEQSCKRPDPAAPSLLALVADDPEWAFKVLAG